MASQSIEEEIVLDGGAAAPIVQATDSEMAELAEMAPIDSDDESSVLLPPPVPECTATVTATDTFADHQADDDVMRETEADSQVQVNLVQVRREEEFQLDYETETTNSIGHQQPLSPTEHVDSDDELPAPASQTEPMSPEDRENEPQESRLTLSPLSLAIADADAAVLTSADGDNIKTKTKIHERLALALSEHQFSQQKRSPDLVPLTRNYQSFRKQLRSLIAAIKAYKKALDQADLARSKLYQEYDVMSRDTPISDFVTTVLDPDQLQLIEQSAGLPPNEEADSPDGLRLVFDQILAGNLERIDQANPTSLASVQQIGQLLAKKTALEHQKYIIDFASEWHEVVTTMLDREIDLVRQLQRRRIHYERKVGALRKRTNNIENKGKQVPASMAEKLIRNEQKLATAWENHEQRAARLCVLLEEVTENGWKDLFPLVQNSMTLEVNRIARDMASLGKLKTVLEKMATSQIISVPATLTYDV